MNIYKEVFGDVANLVKEMDDVLYKENVADIIATNNYSVFTNGHIDIVVDN